MRPNDDTIYQPSERQDSVRETTDKREKNNEWQKVVIGGVTGIFMGAASMYAANAYGQEAKSENEEQKEEQAAQSHTTENGLHVAEVDQSLSFGEAFAQARESVGPGGVFHWHGGIYNTYTASEWNNMTPSQRSDFAHRVSPEIRTGEDDANHYTAHDQSNNQHHGQQDNNQQNDNHHENQQQGHVRPVKDDTHEEPEVHVLGVERVQTDNGSYINVGRARINDEDVALVDLDDDMVFDVRVADLNHNQEIDEGEVVDISDAQITVTDFAAEAMRQGNMTNESGNMAQAGINQEEIAPDMPDYMNDADVSIA